MNSEDNPASLLARARGRDRPRNDRLSIAFHPPTTTHPSSIPRPIQPPLPPIPTLSSVLLHRPSVPQLSSSRPVSTGCCWNECMLSARTSATSAAAAPARANQLLQALAAAPQGAPRPFQSAQQLLQQPSQQQQQQRADSLLQCINSSAAAAHIHQVSTPLRRSAIPPEVALDFSQAAAQCRANIQLSF